MKQLLDSFPSSGTDELNIKAHELHDMRFIDLNLYHFGWEKTNPSQSYGPHARTHYLFHYIIEGKGKLMIGEERYSIAAGQGFLLVPGQTTTYRADDHDPWEYTWIEFDGLRAHEALQQAGIGIRHPIYTSASKEAGNLLRDCMLMMVEHTEYSPFRLIGCGYFFLDQLIASSANRRTYSRRRIQDFYIQESLAFIDHNYQRDISIEEIAAACGLNRSYFSKLFRESMGESPQIFLLHYRMSRAAHLLQETRLSIGEIAAQVGYSNQLHFSAAFKNIYGMSPRGYRQTHFCGDTTK